MRIAASILILLSVTVGCQKPSTVRAATNERSFVEFERVYTYPEFSKRVRTIAFSDSVQPWKVVLSKEHGKAILHRPQVFEYLATDESGKSISCQRGADPASAYAFIGIQPGYGTAKGHVTLHAYWNGTEVSKCDIGTAQPEHVVLKDAPNRDHEFKCSKVVIYGSRSIPPISHVRITTRKPVTDGAIYDATTLQSTYLSLAQMNSQRNQVVVLGTGHPSGIEIFPNSGCQRSIEARVRKYMPVVNSEEVHLDRLTIENVFGMPVAKVDATEVQPTHLGLHVILPKQDHTPNHAPKHIRRILDQVNLLWAPNIIGSEGVWSDPRIKMEVIHPTAEDLNLDEARISANVLRSNSPTTGPFRTGPVPLVVRLTKTTWKLVESRVVHLPVESN
jgi:hypothetical protein